MNKKASPLAVGDDVKANDCATLQSILSDGHSIFHFSRSTLESAIVTLYSISACTGNICWWRSIDLSNHHFFVLNHFYGFCGPYS